jgi:NADPH:quinone reductase-like Zn-dependent oxidoreductase
MDTKMMKYKSVVATQRGGPQVLQIVENDLRAPEASQARIRVLATTVGQTDINYRYGRSPLSPKIPFVPGYVILGVVDAIGAGVTQAVVGDRVAALTGYGGYTEIIILGQEHLVPVPPSLAPAEAVTLILNYVTAYQMLHRVAKVKAGDKVLVIGASGGGGTALLQLGKLAGLKMYGTASPTKHAVLTELGALPIDYHSQDFAAVIRQAEPDGLDYVFDGIGGDYGAVCRKLCKSVELERAQTPFTQESRYRRLWRPQSGAVAARWQASELRRAQGPGQYIGGSRKTGFHQSAAEWQDRYILRHLGALPAR